MEQERFESFVAEELSARVVLGAEEWKANEDAKLVEKWASLYSHQRSSAFGRGSLPLCGSWWNLAASSCRLNPADDVATNKGEPTLLFFRFFFHFVLSACSRRHLAVGSGQSAWVAGVRRGQPPRWHLRRG